VAAEAVPVLAGEFDQATEQQWRAAVDKVLKGAPFERLVSRTADGILVQPLYTDGPDESVTGTPGAAPFTRGFRPQARPGGRWDVRAVVAVADPHEANRLALRELARGASSLLIGGGCLSERSALRDALEGVVLDAAGVTLQAGAAFVEAAQWLMQLWLDRGVLDEAAMGGFGADPFAALAITGELPQGVDRALADMAGLASMSASRFPGVRAVTLDVTPYAEAGASDAQVLAVMLSTAVAYLRALQRAGMAAEDAAGQFELVLGADAEVFDTVARLRAARRVWSTMAEACGIDTGLAAPTITVRTLDRQMSRHDPWVNLLRVTAAAFAGVVGGADALITLPFDAELGEPGELGRRLARNTQLLLGEESGTGRVVDPAGGSWYIETLTEQLAAAAWDLFRELESAGGMPQVLCDGSLAARVAVVRDAALVDVAKRRRPLTGVSEFPDVAEEVPPTPPRSAGRPVELPESERALRCDPLPRVRWAQEFEDLRDAADAFTARSGHGRPAVFLANLGPVAVHTARATFAKNLFEAGGLSAVTSEEGATTGFDDGPSAAAGFRSSGERLVCICSSDDRYAAMAGEVASALRSAGATRVYLAGNPGERRDELAAAGVDEFVHIGVDVLEVLRRAHGLLGIEEAMR
jgi:methylmalonyl-CoA mutase